MKKLVACLAVAVGCMGFVSSSNADVRIEQAKSQTKHHKINSSGTEDLVAGVNEAVIPSGFNPTGEWNVDFQNEALGRSFTSDSEEPLVGDFFNPVRYFAEYVGLLNDLESITVNYDPEAQNVFISGGSLPGTRRLEPGSDSQKNPLLFVNTDSPVADTDEIADDCFQTVGFNEWINFRNSSTLVYYSQNYFTYFREERIGACAESLANLGAMIRANTAPPIFMALAETDALDMNQIQLFEEGDVQFYFDGSRQ